MLWLNVQNYKHAFYISQVIYSYETKYARKMVNNSAKQLHVPCSIVSQKKTVNVCVTRQKILQIC